MKRFKIRIFGLVQGVNFRYHTIEEARRVGVFGWVRNEVDGSVTVIAEGEEEKLNRFLQWLKEGPDLAEVSNVEFLEEPYQGEFKEFGVK